MSIQLKRDPQELNQRIVAPKPHSQLANESFPVASAVSLSISELLVAMLSPKNGRDGLRLYTALVWGNDGRLETRKTLKECLPNPRAQWGEVYCFDYTDYKKEGIVSITRRILNKNTYHD